MLSSTVHSYYFEVILTTIALLFGAIYYFTRNKKDPRYPSGPKPIPLLGNVLQIGNNPLRTFQKWAEEYGPIYSLRLGTQDAVIINDPKLVKELFSERSSAGRPFNPFTHFFGKGKGIVNAGGPELEAQRRFTLRKLRDVGLLKSSIEEALMEEANTLIRFFERKAGKPISGKRLFNGPVVNAIWRLVSGESNDWDSATKPEIVEGSEEVIKHVHIYLILLEYIAPGFFGWTQWVNAVNNFMRITSVAVDKHTDKLDVHNPRDFIDHYLVEMQETKDPASSFYKENGRKNLEAIVGDLFVAGTETSSTTLSWAWLYLLKNKDIQRRAQKELDLIVGESRQPSLSDKPLLPYTEAILLETLRLSGVAPLGAPHRMTADTLFKGYFLPKDLTVISDLYTIHHDPKIWGQDANVFRPERFLNEAGDAVVRHEAFAAFSFGRRQCIGEGFARDALFLFIASILHKFNIDPDPDSPVVDTEPMPGILVEHQPFKCIMNLRKH
ncbi:Farnesoate epoxidase [Orchesella cincta]|uniref:Farnesoate epoxidase n=1 Tax=Orchesella cincta TaxID=48709 RepID=A0A1D2MZV2_ORCCI|nr:Farnesoate epoxidase [Orchesella cincta]